MLTAKSGEYDEAEALDTGAVRFRTLGSAVAKPLVHLAARHQPPGAQYGVAKAGWPLGRRGSSSVRDGRPVISPVSWCSGKIAVEPLDYG